MALDVVNPNFIKTFDAVSHDNLIAKLRKWMVRWIKKWLNGRAQRVGSRDTGLRGYM